ncbi:hypothetical protein M231_01827 [Tremella mesenterica]|uniref:Uncharacterized protein n=1 Tax=Tremella mesenterica TaxID=5217 RepID=A0A4Q1BSH5_TREME|nr:hypothetical protein M231_01827 [Tremella mesenterica]
MRKAPKSSTSALQDLEIEVDQIRPNAGWSKNSWKTISITGRGSAGETLMASKSPQELAREMDELTDELDQSFTAVQNKRGAIDNLMDFQEHESPPLPPTITPPPPPTSPAPSIRSSRNVETDSPVDDPTQRAMVGRLASPLSNSLPPATTEGRGSEPSVQNTTANDIGSVDMPGDDPATSQNSVQIIATPVRHSRSPEAPESHGVRNEDDETMRPSDLEVDSSDREITPLQKIENDEIHRESLQTGGVAGTRDDSEPQSKRRKRGDAQKERERVRA